MAVVPDKDIQSALNDLLNDSFPAMSIAWENVHHVPTLGTPYFRAWLLPASPRVATLGAQPFLERRGIFQVDCCYPLGAGWGPAKSAAATVVSTFYAGLRFVYNSVEVLIERAYPMSGREEEGWYVVPVSIDYSFYSNER